MLYQQVLDPKFREPYGNLNAGLSPVSINLNSRNFWEILNFVKPWLNLTTRNTKNIIPRIKRKVKEQKRKQHQRRSSPRKKLLRKLKRKRNHQHQKKRKIRTPTSQNPR